MKKIVFALFIVIFCSEIQAQRTFSGIKKISNANGTLWINYGYNRSFYSKSDLTLKSYYYDFSVKEGTYSDKQSKSFSDFLSVNTPNSPQYNLNVGYYYMNKYALSIGINHTKMIFDDGNNVLLNGRIDEGTDSIWSGQYNDQQVVTNRNDFHFENNLNYFNLALTRTDKLFQSRNKLFALSANFGLGIGAVVSKNSFRFQNNFTEKIVSMSGFAISGQASARFEFFKNLFIQGELIGASVYQNKIKTRKDNLNTSGKQHFLMGQRVLTFGILIYFKPINGCNDCPVW
ncbi:MAG: hypothetical protein V4622_05920 [Bacteroidota bacterium]